MSRDDRSSTATGSPPECSRATRSRSQTFHCRGPPMRITAAAGVGSGSGSMAGTRTGAGAGAGAGSGTETSRGGSGSGATCTGTGVGAGSGSLWMTRTCCSASAIAGSGATAAGAPASRLPSRQTAASTPSTSRYAIPPATTMRYQRRPTSSAITGTATRNAASTTVRGPKSGLMCRRLRLRVGRLRALGLGRRLGTYGWAGDRGRRRKGALLVRLLRRAHDRGGHLGDRLLSQPCGVEQLLGTLLGAADDYARLVPGRLQGLLSLCAGGVRELGRLMARLLDEPGAPRLGLLQLACRVGLRLRQQLAGLVAGRVHHLGTLALDFLRLPLDGRFAVADLALAAHELLLRAGELGRGGGLCVALGRVGELGRRAAEVQRVHAHGVPAGLAAAGASARSLQHAKLRLQLRDVAAKRVKSLADLIRVEPVPGAGNVLDLRQRSQLGRALLAFGCHVGQV